MAFARLLSRIITPIYNFTSTELYRSNRLFNSLSSGFPFIYLMISRAKKNSQIFLLLFVFSFMSAPLSEVNLVISPRNLYTVRTYFCFQRFGGISWGLIERENIGGNKAQDLIIVVILFLLLLLPVPADTMYRTHCANIISSLCNIIER